VSPAIKIHKLLRKEMEKLGLWSEDLVDELPRKWEVHGDCILLPSTTMTSSCWNEAGRLTNLFLHVFLVHCDRDKGEEEKS